MSQSSTRTSTRNASEKRVRRTQERAELTRGKLLKEATRLFSEQGYDGVSVRDIENAAEVQRGLLGYHFGDKESLWKLAADTNFSLMKAEFDQRMEILKELSSRERLKFIVRFYVHFHARHPELSRLMSQEARQDSWRIRYLVDHHIQPASQKLKKLTTETLELGDDKFMHWYYIMVSASSTIFSFAPECELLFGIDPHQESVVETHAELLVTMLVGA